MPLPPQTVDSLPGGPKDLQAPQKGASSTGLGTVLFRTEEPYGVAYHWI